MKMDRSSILDTKIAIIHQQFINSSSIVHQEFINNSSNSASKITIIPQYVSNNPTKQQDLDAYFLMLLLQLVFIYD